MKSIRVQLFGSQEVPPPVVRAAYPFARSSPNSGVPTSVRMASDCVLSSACMRLVSALISRPRPPFLGQHRVEVLRQPDRLRGRLAFSMALCFLRIGDDLASFPAGAGVRV